MRTLPMVAEYSPHEVRRQPYHDAEAGQTRMQRAEEREEGDLICLAVFQLIYVGRSKRLYA